MRKLKTLFFNQSYGLMNRKIKTLFFNALYKRFPPPMVKYWKRKLAVRAKVTEAPEGHYIMWMEGEPYPFPGFPRGHLLFGCLSPLKHQIKNQIFNETWRRLEEGEDDESIINDMKGRGLDKIIDIADEMKAHFLPVERMVPPVKELHRAWTYATQFIRPDKQEKMNKLRDIMCFILQEDDAYRFRVQWLVNFFPKRNPRKTFDFALQMMEHAEVVGDMKEKIRLLRRVLNLALKDEIIGTLFDIFVKEVDWKKVKLSKADKYYLRAKYFKCDYDKYDY